MAIPMCDGNRLPYQRTQPIGHALQQLVANRMAQRVVHSLEAVEIDQMECNPWSASGQLQCGV
jgi:hypothetical protein